jgi:hypothetical protein
LNAGPTPLRTADTVDVDWLSTVLGTPVLRFEATAEAALWSSHLRLRVELADGSTRALRLKVCQGTTFGRSEVDYYVRDYLGLVAAPLVRCHDAVYVPGEGYHLLLDDLADTHTDRRTVPPTLDYGLAVAEALARMHALHWQSRAAPAGAALDRYFDEIRPGVPVIEQMTGLAFSAEFTAHEAALRLRWADPRGMSLLHGDLNGSNVLTPRGSPSPVLLLDRQPFDWSLIYGLAVHDLAYFMVLWWPEQALAAWAGPVLRRWHATLAQPGYDWPQVLLDWRLSVRQCLHVPFEWCSKPETAGRMRWLWQAQLQRVQAALS